MKNLSKITVLAFAAISFTFASCGGETNTAETTETEITEGATTDSAATMTTPMDSAATTTTDSAAAQ